MEGPEGTGLVGFTVDLEGLGADGVGTDGFGADGVGSTSDGGGGGFEGDCFSLDLEGAGPEAEGVGPGDGGGDVAPAAALVPCSRPGTPAKLGAAIPASSTIVSSAVSTAIGNPRVFRLRPTVSPS